MKSSLLIAILCFATFFSLKGQDDPVIVVEMADENTEQSKTNNKYNHVIKLNPLIFLHGDVPIYYESNFRNNISLEGGLGITLKDFMGDAFSLSDNTETEITEDINLGYSFRLGVRYYSANYGFDPEGLYFGLTYRQQNYSSQLSSVASLDANNEELKQSNKDVFLSVGYVFLIDENAFLDPYIGFGVRSKSFDEVTYSGVDYSISDKSTIAPLIVAGLKFAISL